MNLAERRMGADALQYLIDWRQAAQVAAGGLAVGSDMVPEVAQFAGAAELNVGEPQAFQADVSPDANGSGRLSGLGATVLRRFLG